MAYQNSLTGEEFTNEDDYLRSLKRNDSYYFSYEYEYVADRFGDNDEDVTLRTATLNLTVSWDDSPAPGYSVSYTVDSPTPIPNDWTGDADQIFDDLWPKITSDLDSEGIRSELYKDWPV